MSKVAVRGEVMSNVNDERERRRIELDRRLAAAAKAASRDAVAKAFAAGLSITIFRDGKLIRIAPDGTETVVDG